MIYLFYWGDCDGEIVMVVGWEIIIVSIMNMLDRMGHKRQQHQGAGFEGACLNHIYEGRIICKIRRQEMTVSVLGVRGTGLHGLVRQTSIVRVNGKMGLGIGGR